MTIAMKAPLIKIAIVTGATTGTVGIALSITNNVSSASTIDVKTATIAIAD